MQLHSRLGGDPRNGEGVKRYNNCELNDRFIYSVIHTMNSEIYSEIPFVKIQLKNKCDKPSWIQGVVLI